MIKYYVREHHATMVAYIEAHFTNDFSIIIRIQHKFHLALTHIFRSWFLPNFTHAITYVPSWHGQNLEGIGCLWPELQQNKSFHWIWMTLDCDGEDEMFVGNILENLDHITAAPHNDIIPVCNYRKISNIRRIKSQNLNVSRLVLQLPLPNPLKPGVKSRMKM